MKEDRPTDITLFIFSILLILIMPIDKITFAQERTEKDQNNWSVEVGYKSAYDNNILKYSDKYLDRFVNNEDEGRFHIKKYDDLEFEYSARLAYSKNILENLRSIISARVDFNQYSFNTIKSWISYDLGWQQYINKKTSIMISYSYLPDFYIAHYRDDDWIKIYGYTPETFQPYSFSKTDYSIWIQYLFSSSIKARLYLSYMDYFYNEHFTEYDSKNFMFGGRVFNELSDLIMVDAGYKYISSNAQGYDDPYETKENSNDNDASYSEHVLSAGIEYKIPKILRLNNTISISADFILRHYTTEHSVESDPLHARRNDFNYRLYFDYNIDILNNFSAGVFFNLLFRDADSLSEMNREYVSDEKDYNQFQLGLDLNYKFQF